MFASRSLRACRFACSALLAFIVRERNVWCSVDLQPLRRVSHAGVYRRFTGYFLWDSEHVLGFFVHCLLTFNAFTVLSLRCSLSRTTLRDRQTWLRY